MIRTIYKDEVKELQRLIIRIGDCQMTIYREIAYDEFGDLGVTEIKEPPLWFLRYKKLKQLGL